MEGLVRSPTPLSSSSEQRQREFTPHDGDTREQSVGSRPGSAFPSSLHQHHPGQPYHQPSPSDPGANVSFADSLWSAPIQDGIGPQGPNLSAIDVQGTAWFNIPQVIRDAIGDLVKKVVNHERGLLSHHHTFESVKLVSGQERTRAETLSRRVDFLETRLRDHEHNWDQARVKIARLSDLAAKLDESVFDQRLSTILCRLDSRDNMLRQTEVKMEEEARSLKEEMTREISRCLNEVRKRSGFDADARLRRDSELSEKVEHTGSVVEQVRTEYTKVMKAVESLDAKLAENITGVHETITGVRETITGVQREHSGDIEALKSTIQETQELCGKRLSTACEHTDSSVAACQQSLLAQIQSSCEHTDSSVAECQQSLLAQIQSSVETESSMLSAKFEALLSEVSTEIKSVEDVVSQKVEGMSEMVQTNISGSCKVIEESSSRLEGEVEHRLSEVDGKVAAASAMLVDVEQQLHRHLEQLSAYREELREKANTDVENMRADWAKTRSAWKTHQKKSVRAQVTSFERSRARMAMESVVRTLAANRDANVKEKFVEKKVSEKEVLANRKLFGKVFRNWHAHMVARRESERLTGLNILCKRRKAFYFLVWLDYLTGRQVAKRNRWRASSHWRMHGLTLALWRMRDAVSYGRRNRLSHSHFYRQLMQKCLIGWLKRLHLSFRKRSLKAFLRGADDRTKSTVVHGWYLLVLTLKRNRLHCQELLEKKKGSLLSQGWCNWRAWMASNEYRRRNAAMADLFCDCNLEKRAFFGWIVGISWWRRFDLLQRRGQLRQKWMLLLRCWSGLVCYRQLTRSIHALTRRCETHKLGLVLSAIGEWFYTKRRRNGVVRRHQNRRLWRLVVRIFDSMKSRAQFAQVRYNTIQSYLNLEKTKLKTTLFQTWKAHTRRGRQKRLVYRVIHKWSSEVYAGMCLHQWRMEVVDRSRRRQAASTVRSQWQDHQRRACLRTWQTALPHLRYESRLRAKAMQFLRRSRKRKVFDVLTEYKLLQTVYYDDEGVKDARPDVGGYFAYKKRERSSTAPHGLVRRIQSARADVLMMEHHQRSHSLSEVRSLPSSRRESPVPWGSHRSGSAMDTSGGRHQRRQEEKGGVGGSSRYEQRSGTLPSPSPSVSPTPSVQGRQPEENRPSPFLFSPIPQKAMSQSNLLLSRRSLSRPPSRAKDPMDFSFFKR